MTQVHPTADPSRPAVDGARVLIVTNHFPPATGSAVNRVAGFTRYLPRHGWQPIVLTVRNPVGVAWDPAAVDLLPPEARIVRTAWINPQTIAKRAYFLAKGQRVSGTEEVMFTPLPANERTDSLRRWMNRWLLVPDHAVGWMPFAIWGGLRAIRRYRPNVLYSLCRPPSNHVIALALKRLTGLPWVADFQDLWTGTAYEEVGYVYDLRWRRRLETWLEHRVLEGADQVVALSEFQLAALAESMHDPDPTRLHVIRDGFEPETVRRTDGEASERFTLSYTGKFYRNELRYVCESIAALKQSGRIDPGSFELRIVGVSHQEVAEAVAAHGIEDLVTTLPPVDRTQALREQHHASALLLVLGPEEGRIGRYPSKLFEYLAARRPILAMVPQGAEVTKLLHESASAVVVDPTDPTAAAEAIGAMVNEFATTGAVSWHGRQEVIDAYGREALTGDLAAILDSLVTGRGPSS